MKGKLILLCTILSLLNGCALNQEEDPLILPPDFDEIPNLAKKENEKEDKSANSKNSDIEELRDLLLKN